MVARRGTTTTSNSSGDNEIITKMWVAMDEMHRHNQILEDNILNLQQRWYKDNPLKEVNIFDLQPLSDEIWAALVLENFKPLSLVGFDGKSVR